MKNILTNKKNKTSLLTYGVVTVAFIIMQTLSSLGMLKSSVNGYLVPVTAVSNCPLPVSLFQCSVFH